MQRASAPLRYLSLGKRRSTRACRARALRTVPTVIAPCPVIGHCTSERSPFSRARPCSLVQLRSPLREPARAFRELVRHRAGCLWGECSARAPRCVGCGRSMPYERALRKREAALLRCTAVLPHASCGVHFVSRLTRVACLCATALPLFREAAQYARLPRVRTANCAGCGYSIPSGRALYAQETALFRCKAVLARASCSVHFVKRLARVARLCATVLAVSGEEAQHARSPRAFFRAALAVVAPYHTKKKCTSERPPIFGARLCSHVPGTASTW